METSAGHRAAKAPPVLSLWIKSRDFDPAVFARAVAELFRRLDRVHAVSPRAEQVRLARRPTRDEVEAGLIDRDGSSETSTPISCMQGSSATAQQSQSTDRFFMTAT